MVEIGVGDMYFSIVENQWSSLSSFLIKNKKITKISFYIKIKLEQFWETKSI